MFQTIESPATRTAAAAISGQTGIVKASGTEPILCVTVSWDYVDCQFSTCSHIQQAKIGNVSAQKGASVEQLITAVDN